MTSRTIETVKPPTLKMLNFVSELFKPEVSFNSTEAYRRAYPKCKGGHNALAARLIAKDSIRQLIAKKKAKIRAQSVATRQQRQQFWTEVYLDSTANMGDRLRASELLGKSEADFTENINTNQEKSLKQLSEQQQMVVDEFLEWQRSRPRKVIKATEVAQDG